MSNDRSGTDAGVGDEVGTSGLWVAPAVDCPVVVPHERATAATTIGTRMIGHRCVVERSDVIDSINRYHP
jgi:hypothetical protein